MSVFIVVLVLIQTACGCEDDFMTSRANLCLDQFLERDFPAIEYHITPDRLRSLENASKVENICRQLGVKIDCYRDAGYNKCFRYLSEQYHQVMEGLATMYEWLCDGPKPRLQVLLPKLRDVSDLWSRVCREDRELADFTRSYVMQRILSVEDHSSLCRPLSKKMECLLKSDQMTRKFGPAVAETYNQTMNVFLNAWCSAASVQTKPSIIVTSAVILLWINFC